MPKKKDENDVWLCVRCKGTFRGSGLLCPACQVDYDADRIDDAAKLLEKYGDEYAASMARRAAASMKVNNTAERAVLR